MIKYPTDRDVAILRAKATISELPHQVLGDDDDDERKLENEFWTELKKVGLEPDSEEYNEVSIDIDIFTCICTPPILLVLFVPAQVAPLKKELKELRNQTVLVFVVTNIIWIVLITLLAQHANLTVLGTNALGLGFLVIYGLIFSLQFLTLIWHRLSTIVHALAHPIHDSTDIIPLGFDEYDLDLLDDHKEARNYFPPEMPCDSGDETLTDLQQQNKRPRRFQRMLGSSNMPRSEETLTQHLLSSSSGEKYSC